MQKQSYFPLKESLYKTMVCYNVNMKKDLNVSKMFPS